MAAEMRPKKNYLPNPSEKTENWREFSNSCPSIIPTVASFQTLTPQSFLSFYVVNKFYYLGATRRPSRRNGTSRGSGFLLVSF
jgi:hypothetical protein